MNKPRNTIVAAIALVVSSFFAEQATAGMVTTTSYLTISNELTNDPMSVVVYGTVDVRHWDGDPMTDNDNTLTITVTPSTTPYGGTGTNFGIQVFGFNYDKTQVLPNFVDNDSRIELPDGWSVNAAAPPPNNLSEFGTFVVAATGTGSTRANPLVIPISDLGDENIYENFHILSMSAGDVGEAYYVAHIAGFPTTGGVTSHWVGDIGTDPFTVLETAPEPASLTLLGMGILGVLGVARRRRNDSVQA